MACISISLNTMVSLVAKKMNLSQSMNPYPLDTLLLVLYVAIMLPPKSLIPSIRVEMKFQLCCGLTHVRSKMEERECREGKGHAT